MADLGRMSTPRLRVLLALHTKGVADAAAVGDAAGLTVEAAARELEVAVDADLVSRRPGPAGGHSLTPEGRFLLQRMLRDELEEPGVRDAVDAAYREFLGVNGDLLAVCTAWQLRTADDGAMAPNDHTDAPYDAAVIDRLAEVHGRMGDVLERLADALGRFARYGPALQNALDRLRTGDHDYFTRPLFPSYHSIWFELHEDLLVTLDTSRRHERSCTQ